MTNSVEKLKLELSQLSLEVRAELAHFLIASLEDEERDPDYDAAWAAEIQRRIDDMESGRVQGIPAEEVFAKLRAKYS